MHSQSALMEHVSLNLAGTFLLNPVSLTSFKIGVSMCVRGRNHGNQAPIQNKWLVERPNHDVATLLASQQIASRLTKIMSYTPRDVFPNLRGMF